MAIDLMALRETAKGHHTDLLVKKRNTQFDKKKVGRPNKKENQFLTQRITLILTEERVFQTKYALKSLHVLDSLRNHTPYTKK